MRDRPSRVPPSERERLVGQQTSAMIREQAFAGDDRWIGLVRTEAGAWSGWHHHGETDTYFYVLRGSIELEYGRDGAVLAVEAGDFAHLPPKLVHRERTTPGEPGEIVLVRLGPGPSVVNAEAPDA